MGCGMKLKLNGGGGIPLGFLDQKVEEDVHTQR